MKNIRFIQWVKQLEEDIGLPPCWTLQLHKQSGQLSNSQLVPKEDGDY